MWYITEYKDIKSCDTHSRKNVLIWSSFWSVFSRIWTKYGDLLRVSPYLVQIKENTDQKKLCIWTFFAQWLKWRSFEYKSKIEKKVYLFRSGIGIFEIFFKSLYEESFDDLQINSNWKFQTLATMSHKMVTV